LFDFNLPPIKEKLSPLSSNANVEELWNCLINKYPAYENLYTPSEEFNDKGFLILNRKQAGYCQVCEKEHESSGAYLFIKGEEETVLLGCYRKEQYKPDDKYKFITCLKPKLKESCYEPYVPHKIDADEVYDEPVMRPLPTDKPILLVKRAMGKEKTKSLVELLKGLINLTQED